MFQLPKNDAVFMCRRLASILEDSGAAPMSAEIEALIADAEQWRRLPTKIADHLRDKYPPDDCGILLATPIGFPRTTSGEVGG